jgi:two-component system LytT family response regulator
MSLRVLIVDDEPLARAGVRARLAGHAGVSVLGEFGDGSSALAFMQSQSPDLLFIDVEMPGLSGLDVVEALTPE